jgi:peptidoglycan/xylan/chitin deacetylase (PgdA/CDA1 family)
VPTVVLAYHDVAAAGERAATGFTGPGPDRYKLEPAAFAAQLDAVAAAGGAGLLHDGRPVTLTFDDGGSSALGTIAPLLEERGWRGHFFVTTGRIGTPGFLDEDGVRELAARGHDVGSHSHTHPVLTRLSDELVAEEWTRSRQILEELLGREVGTASVPTGYYAERVARAAAAAGYATLFTSEPWLEPRRLGALELVGRFAVTAATPSARVAALAAGSRAALLRQSAGWQARKAAKLALGPLYGRIRHAALGRRG